MTIKKNNRKEKVLGSKINKNNIIYALGFIISSLIVIVAIIKILIDNFTLIIVTSIFLFLALMCFTKIKYG